MQKSSFNIWRGCARALQLFAKIGLCLALCVFAMDCKSAEEKINFHNSKNILYVCGAGYFKINQDATNINYKTETEIRGRRTAESAAVLSRHRFGVSSSDLPSLFDNQNFNVMLDTMDNGTKCAEKIIKDFIFNDEVKNIRQTLTELFYEWVRSEIKYDQKKRAEVLYHYRCLLGFLQDAENYEQERRAS